MLMKLIGFMFALMGSFSVSAASLGPCFDNQDACNKVCIEKGDMACLEQCGSEGQMCLERESQAKSNTAGVAPTASSGTNSSTNLQGCWRSQEKLTTWCFTGTTSEITTDSYVASGGKRITGLNRVSLSGTSMTYYIVRAAMTGPGAYDNSVNKGSSSKAKSDVSSVRHPA